MHKNKKFNKFDLSGDYGIGYTLKNEEFYFDLIDFEKIKEHCWYIETGGRVCARNKSGKTPIKLHRFILDVIDPKIEIDHINRNQRDNRRENLRICSHKENIRNIKIPSNNTSGIIGVTFRSDTQRYSAMIEVDGKRICLGCFKNIEDAIISRLKAEKEYFKEFSPQKHLFDKYNI